MSFSRPQSTPPLGLYRYGQTNDWDQIQTQYPESSRSQKHSTLPAGNVHHPLHYRYSESTSDENMGVGKRKSNPETQFRPPNIPMSSINGSNHSYSRRRSGTYSHHVPLRTSQKSARPTHRISDGNLQISPPGGGGQGTSFQRKPPAGGINVADWVASSSLFQNLQSHSQTVPDWSSSEQSLTVGSQLSYSASPEGPPNLTPSWDNYSIQSDTTQVSGMSEPFRHPRHQPHPRPHSTSSTHPRPPSPRHQPHPRPHSTSSTHPRPPSVGSMHSHPPSVSSIHSHPPSDGSTHSRPPSTSSTHSRPPSVGSTHSYSNSVPPTFPSERNGRRATSPNIATTRVEAWQLEEEDELPLEFRGRRTTISHINEVMASRIHRHYFHTSPMATSPSSPPHSQPLTTTTTVPNHTATGDRPMSPYREYTAQFPYENMVVSPQRGPYSGYQDPRGVLAAETTKQHSRKIVSNMEYRTASPTPYANLLSPSDSESGGGIPHPHASHSPNHMGPEAQPVPQVQYHHSYALTQDRPSKYPPNSSNRPTSPKNESNFPAAASLSDTDLDRLPKRTEKGSPKRDRSRSKSSPSQRAKNHGESRLFSIKRRNKLKNSPAMEKKAVDSELTKAQIQKRRISSPEGQYTSQLMQKYFPSSEDSPDDQVMSDSETSSHKSAHSKTSGSSLVFQKLVRKLGKIKGSGGESAAASSSTVSSGEKVDKTGFRMSRKKSRTQSFGTLEGVDGPAPLSRSLEQLSPEPLDRILDGFKGLNTPGATPTGTPTGTPKMSRSWSKTKLGRRGSGPDPELEGTLSILFKSGSKKNLAMDPSEILFEYIEQGNVEGVQQLLEANMIPELNATNEDDFTPVDLASTLNQTAIARLLLARGAKDSAKFCRDPFSRFTRITMLLMESERELDSLKCELVTQNVGNNSVKELERRLRKWEWRAHLFRKMKANYEHSDVPHPPTNVSLNVTSNCSLSVRWAEPEDTNGAVVTRYRIEWCRSEQFAPIVGEFVMTDLRSTEYAIPDLNKGERYHVRVSAFNMRGFGPAQMATPPSAVPSSWHDVSGSRPRFEGSTDNIHIISAQLSMTLSNSPPLSPTHTGTPSFNSRRAVKKGISKIFGSGIKFQKSPKPGIHLASLVYSDDSKVLVTVDDNIPIVEVSDSPSSSVGVDFVWLAKIACTWDHVRGMCSVSDTYVSSPAVQFRNKLLHAILDLQGALGMQDLGLLHPVPYKDSQGAITFVIVQYLKDARSMQSSSLKWVGLPRLWKKRPQPSSGDGLETLSIADQLILDAQEMIAHHSNSTRPLAKGLYLGYLKARSSLASMKVICSREYPNVLPHIRIRDNPNVSSDEWVWLKSLSSPSHTSHTPNSSTGSQSLQKLLLPTIDTFLHNLGISKEDAEKHQLYHHEVIELNEGISLLLLLPPYEQICTAPGSSDHFANIADFIALPINTFEIMQLYTYQKAFMTRFSMVSARLDIELLASQHRMREAFSKEEVTAAKELQSELEGFQERTEQAWKQMRWIEEALQRGRSLSSLGAESLMSIKTLRETVRARPPNGLAIKRASSVQTVHRAGPTSGFLRVFPAYETGLVKGTSVKLYITMKTIVSEVIRLVVQQLEKARFDRGIPGRQLMEEDLSDFYLVAINNSKEWLLDKNFNPLQLQTQSSKCRLFVKRQSEDLKIDDQATSV